MRREFYEARLEPHRKKAFKSTVAALHDAVYWLGRWAAEKYEEDDPIRSELISLIAQYSMKLEEDIYNGKIAQEKLKKLSDSGDSKSKICNTGGLISDCFNNEINDIIKKVENLNASGLFHAYDKLTCIQSIFDNFKIPNNDKNYGRLMSVRIKVKLLLADKLARYDATEKI